METASVMPLDRRGQLAVLAGITSNPGYCYRNYQTNPNHGVSVDMTRGCEDEGDDGLGVGTSHAEDVSKSGQGKTLVNRVPSPWRSMGKTHRKDV